ncbi:MAG: aminopeptidase, partial [Acidobacteria bacterium]|nr:aminopeptidase [Acidobacteriota bacterium]
MYFGPFPDALCLGAHNAVDVCLDIQPGERVALIADEASRDVA